MLSRSQVERPDAEARYTALRIMRVVYRISALVAIVLGGARTIASFDAGWLMGAINVFVTWLAVMTLLAASETIKLLFHAVDQLDRIRTRT